MDSTFTVKLGALVFNDKDDLMLQKIPNQEGCWEIPSVKLRESQDLLSFFVHYIREKVGMAITLNDQMPLFQFEKNTLEIYFLFTTKDKSKDENFNFFSFDQICAMKNYEEIVRVLKFLKDG